MSEDELRAIEAEADGDCSNCAALIAEVRRLMLANAKAWVALNFARDHHEPAGSRPCDECRAVIDDAKAALR